MGSVLALVLGSSTAANANVLYDNLPSQANINDFTVLEFAMGGNGYIANQFLATATACPSGCTLGNIRLVMSSGFPITPDAYQLKVVSDLSANPGASVNMTYQTGLATNNAFVDFAAPSGSQSFTLQSNTNYWVQLIRNGGTQASWFFMNPATQNAPSPSQPQPEHIFYDFGDGNSGDIDNVGYSMLMRVEATPNVIPLPGAIWMMGSALIGLVLSWRQKATG